MQPPQYPSGKIRRCRRRRQSVIPSIGLGTPVDLIVEVVEVSRFLAIFMRGGSISWTEGF